MKCTKSTLYENLFCDFNKFIMKIDIWSDPVCIFSYIGNHRLKNVLRALSLENSIVLEWHSFIIYPHYYPNRKLSSALKFYKREHGISRRKAKLLCNDLNEFASFEGLHVNFDKIIPCNTYNSHRLLKMARQYNLQTELVYALSDAYFADGKDISNIPVLADVGEDVGIPKEDILKMYEGSDYMIEVRRDIERAFNLKFFHTPGLFIDGRISMIGNYYEEWMADLISSAYKEYCRRCSCD